MPVYRYVSQGEYYITSDPEVELITSGMTDCIALAYVDKKDSRKRLLTHLDGFLLTNYETALTNLRKITSEFKEKTNASDFDIFLLGGQANFRNYRILLPAMESLHL